MPNIAQEQMGMLQSNFLSSSSIFLNPSSSADAHVYMQLNLASAGAFAYTNGAYIPSFSVWRMKRANGEVQYPKASTVKVSKFVYANAFAEGPAFVISKRLYGAGFFVRARSILDIRGIPYPLANMLLQQNPYANPPSTYNINKRNIKGANLSWLEYGGNFSYIIRKQQKDLISIGGNLKYITGINIFYFNIAHMKGFYNDTVVSVDEVNAKLRMNSPAFNSGKGLGLDLGITYKKMLKNIETYYPNSEQSNCTYIDYKYKLALSLRDAGYIRFKGSTINANFNASGYYRIDTTRSITEAAITNSLNGTLYSGNITASLPTNICAQADYNFENGFYASALIVKNILPNQVTGVAGSNIWAICGRFERKNFELALPLTFQKFIYPQLGMAVRYRSFVLGFDNVFPLLFMKNTYGLGIYTKLAISLFKNPACRKRSRIADCPPSILEKDHNFVKKVKRVFKRKK